MDGRKPLVVSTNAVYPPTSNSFLLDANILDSTIRYDIIPIREGNKWNTRGQNQTQAPSLPYDLVCPLPMRELLIASTS